MPYERDGRSERVGVGKTRWIDFTFTIPKTATPETLTFVVEAQTVDIKLE